MNRKRTNKKYSPEFKLSVILDMRNNHLSYSETIRKYFPHLKVFTSDFLKRWEHIYLTEGFNGFMVEHRGKSTEGKKRGRPPKLDNQIDEDLISEVKRLRAENECLKKLDALVREREERETRKKLE